MGAFRTLRRPVARPTGRPSERLTDSRTDATSLFGQDSSASPRTFARDCFIQISNWPLEKRKTRLVSERLVFFSGRFHSRLSRPEISAGRHRFARRARAEREKMVARSPPKWNIRCLMIFVLHLRIETCESRSGSRTDPIQFDPIQFDPIRPSVGFRRAQNNSINNHYDYHYYFQSSQSSTRRVKFKPRQQQLAGPSVRPSGN